MTDPAPNDPANDPTPEPTNEPEPGNEPEPTNEPSGDEDARIKRANREAAKYRTERNEAQQQLEQVQQAQQEQATTLDALRKALGLDTGDGGDDPAQQVTELTGRVDTLTNDNRNLRAELAVYDIAADNGANASALLDSRKFADKLHGLDPDSETFRDDVTDAIKTAVNDNAAFRAAGQGSARGGASGAGAGSSQPEGAVTQEQFNAMSYADRVELHQSNPDLYRRLAG